MRSREWVCPQCNQCNLKHLPDPQEGPSKHANVSSPSSAPPADTAEVEVVEDSSAAPVVPTPDSDRIEEERQIHMRGTAQFTRRSSHRPPLILDTAICVLLVLVLALLCRRVL